MSSLVNCIASLLMLHFYIADFLKSKKRSFNMRKVPWLGFGYMGAGGCSHHNPRTGLES